MTNDTQFQIGDKVTLRHSRQIFRNPNLRKGMVGVIKDIRGSWNITVTVDGTDWSMFDTSLKIKSN